MADVVLRAEGLWKRYDELEVLRGVSSRSTAAR